MAFFAQPWKLREREIRRVMWESRRDFSHARVAGHYLERYEEMLVRPLVRRGEADADG
jgi:hypothetical protein